jgi:polar amino acid transport system permease protein
MNIYYTTINDMPNILTPKIPYPSSIRKGAILDIFKFGLVIVFLCWLTITGNENLGYNWQWYKIPGFLFTIDKNSLIPGPLLKGLYVTLKITGLSLIFAIFAGLSAALLRISNSLTGRAISFLYLETIRNTPLLIQLFFIYFVIAPIFDTGRFTSGVLALGLFEGAYISEIFRAGILSVEKGQKEAAYCLSLNAFHSYTKIIIPQAVRRILPSLTSQIISLIKDSALVSTIAIYDLTMEGRVIISETFLTFEIWFTIALIYLLITVTISLLVKRLEKNRPEDVYMVNK